MANFLQTVRERVVVYDGAMGTNIHKHNPTLDDYWGKENCSEVLVLSRPDIIRDIHASFFEVGCDVDRDQHVRCDQHRACANSTSPTEPAKSILPRPNSRVKLPNNSRPNGSLRFVAGSIGPTTKLPSLGHISFEDMAAAYEEQALALIEGGVDLLLIETAQDLLQAKIACIGCPRRNAQSRQASAGDGAGHAAGSRHHASGD